MIRRPGYRFRISRALGIAAVALAIATVSCGPELNSPASSDVSGTWFAPGPVAGLTNITVVLTQTPDGAITGTYTATGTPNLQFCPLSGPCVISGVIINGTNTVFQVFFELKDAGQFTGQLIDANILKGSMSRISATGHIQFAKS
jgi:hypothetical protein